MHRIDHLWVRFIFVAGFVTVYRVRWIFWSNPFYRSPPPKPVKTESFQLRSLKLDVAAFTPFSYGCVRRSLSTLNYCFNVLLISHPDVVCIRVLPCLFHHSPLLAALNFRSCCVPLIFQVAIHSQPFSLSPWHRQWSVFPPVFHLQLHLSLPEWIFMFLLQISTFIYFIFFHLLIVTHFCCNLIICITVVVYLYVVDYLKIFQNLRTVYAQTPYRMEAKSQFQTRLIDSWKVWHLEPRTHMGTDQAKRKMPAVTRLRSVYVSFLLLGLV